MITEDPEGQPWANPYVEARQVLARALDVLDEASKECLTTPEQVHVVVIYSVWGLLDEKVQDEVGGFISSPGPAWLQAALLRKAARELETQDRPEDHDA